MPFPSLAILTGKIAADLMLNGPDSRRNSPRDRDQASVVAPAMISPFLLVAPAPPRRRRAVVMKSIATLSALALLVTLLGALLIFAAASATGGSFCGEEVEEGCTPSFGLTWYFSVCTFGMAGYGELLPDAGATRVVTAAYILACMPIYPLVAGIIAAGLIESRKAATTASGGVPLEPLPLVTTHRTTSAVSPTTTDQSGGTTRE